MTRTITPNNGAMTVCFTFKPGSSMLESERNLQCAANGALTEATGACLERFDTETASPSSWARLGEGVEARRACG